MDSSPPRLSGLLLPTALLAALLPACASGGEAPGGALRRVLRAGLAEEGAGKLRPLASRLWEREAGSAAEGGAAGLARLPPAHELPRCNKGRWVGVD